MTLKKTYLIWLASLAIALSIAFVYYCLSTYRAYGTLTPDEPFAGIGYLLLAIFIAIAGTGLLTAFWVYRLYRTKQPILAKKLSLRLAFFHVFGVIPVYILSVFGLVFFALFPYLAWRDASDSRKLAGWLVAFIVVCTYVIGVVAFTLFIDGP